ncbi:ABC transporter permease [Bdellovibrio bacteriovorus]|uniref:Dipeptide transport system permease protein DppB n=1 Tax=Bdellovibrio bacteriovorus (strain ATCC 15356 / DSM 50701 / NCIMB 9529 / HD100) TaxID=264462 RepID=Q6ML30_BDEBA|nr:ABC transporter permease [Bdellovibrio bacteriovorus]CAE80027.1 dipeptide transport system permease protein DppB [Bdellovibrio bacteriovorus HD100]
MTTFITRRILQTLAVIVILSYVCFYLMSLMPGDPVDMMVASNPKITAEDVARLKSLYGLDQPVYKRYASWMGSILQGDLGYSRTYRVPVQELMGPRLWNTFLLSAISLILSIGIAIPLGVISALKPGSRTDYIVNLFSFGGISIPSFWLAIVLIILFAVKFPVLPAGGTQTIGASDLGLWADIKDRSIYLILPVLSLSIQQIGRFSRFTRSAMLEAMRNDFIRTARAKGLSRKTVIWQHGFRNALIPLITILALSFSGLFSGAILTETVFAYQGVGKLVYDSIIGNDYNVAMISFVISVSMVLLMNLVADIMYGFADPRISYQ